MFSANCVTFMISALLVHANSIAARSRSTSCEELHRAYAKNDPARELTVFGSKHWLSVYHEDSKPSRAAAMLLLTVLRYGLRYKQVRMRTLPSSGLCGIQLQPEVDEDPISHEHEVVLAPSISWNETAPSSCVSEKETEVEPLRVLGAGAAPVSLDPPSKQHSSYLHANRTIRVAEISKLRKFAPSVLEVFGRFSPRPNDIRKMFPNFSLETACKWALNNSEVFENWLQITRTRVYEVAAYLCQDDPDNKEYIEILKQTLVTYNIHKNEDLKFNLKTNAKVFNVNCSDEYSLMKKFMERAHSFHWPRLIGVIASGAGIRATKSVASVLDTVLVQYDIPVPGDEFPPTRTATGRLQHLSLGIQYFLASCKWTRLAVISEDTKLACALMASLSSENNLIVRDVSVTRGVKTALSTLFAEKARIIFINGNPDTASTVLCMAHEEKKLITTSYVWILREWRFKGLTCSNYTIQENEFLHFTISFWWRGGDVNSLPPNTRPKKDIHRQIQNRLTTRVWPIRAAPLVDAVTILLHGFYNLLQSRYSIDDLHNNDTNRAFWASYDANPAQGVMQQLNSSQAALSCPLIYVYNSQSELEAVWKIYDDRVHVLYQPRPFFDEIMRPSDGRVSCWTTSTGSKFMPRCHDAGWFTGLVAIIIAIPTALYARRARQQLIARRDSVFTARLLARGRRASVALAPYLVDRATLKLDRELGNGRYGRVRLGVLRPPGKPPLVVAAKTLREEATQADEREFLNEAVTIASLSHEHIVRLIGVCATGGPPLVLMEHAFFGDLRKYLHERRHLVETVGHVSAETKQVSGPALTRLACQAAKALDYLRLKRIVHRDVRASNCLIDARRSLKLADFGLARKTETKEGNEEYKCRRSMFLPAMWMAPESLERGIFTADSDVWALGVLLLELVTLGARPYGHWSPDRVMRYVCAGGYPPLPRDATPELRLLLLQCWRHVPAERVSAAELARQLSCSPAALRPALQSPEYSEP
ncbi:hypothetical protein evm_011778 [Chilo suppressalis]|nr:hypothetical protein evm_011778 [Chilo suppressalis]